ncbi:MAG: hypothetical protein ABGZ35_23035, partial [Planctomycetaceae bacterium]
MRSAFATQYALTTADGPVFIAFCYRRRGPSGTASVKPIPGRSRDERLLEQKRSEPYARSMATVAV